MKDNYFILDGAKNILASVYIPPDCYNHKDNSWDSLGNALIRYVRAEAKKRPKVYEDTDTRWQSKSWFERMRDKEMIPTDSVKLSHTLLKGYWRSKHRRTY